MTLKGDAVKEDTPFDLGLSPDDVDPDAGDRDGRRQELKVERATEEPMKSALEAPADGVGGDSTTSSTFVRGSVQGV